MARKKNFDKDRDKCFRLGDVQVVVKLTDDKFIPGSSAADPSKIEDPGWYRRRRAIHEVYALLSA